MLDIRPAVRAIYRFLLNENHVALHDRVNIIILGAKWMVQQSLHCFSMTADCVDCAMSSTRKSLYLQYCSNKVRRWWRVSREMMGSDGEEGAQNCSE